MPEQYSFPKNWWTAEQDWQMEPHWLNHDLNYTFKKSTAAFPRLNV
jgi:hypothetical protein